MPDITAFALLPAVLYGPAAFIMRARTEGLRDFGSGPSPTNAFQLLQGVETLGVRMDRHIANLHAVGLAARTRRSIGR